MLEVGDTIPDLSVTDDTGATRRTRDLLGTSLVLWFYPKDDTPG